jgi:hypothetical protein
MATNRGMGQLSGPSAKHSPGNWMFERYDETRFEINSDTPKWAAIATVTQNHLGSREVGPVEAEANARLIAAAPDLLDALQAIVAIADRKTVEFDRARAAIAKAEGK